KVTGMGGAMDLVNGAKTVIIMMTHFSKKGDPKILKTCTLPLTGKSVVDIVVTDKGIFKPVNNKIEIVELADGILKEDLGLDLILA
ncbi:MAG: succinyl-CoA--3-ketoacid-CoA transferase, partial [Bacteriovoracaceae bacterium]|nr:succinyl-CoA--3-ketoacid-CoA transferase [Bacteriovoracaceae bacterium]